MNDMLSILKKRRSTYAIGNTSPISDNDIEQLMKDVLHHTPAAFNAPDQRIVLLFGEGHLKLWDITKEILQGITNPEQFSQTKTKIDSFAAGHGTVLFYEDLSVVENMQSQYPVYAHQFPIWSLEQAGILQINIWQALVEAGLGASLQHYNPLIDEAVASQWRIPASWKLVAQMPFGNIVQSPGEKQFPDRQGHFKRFDQ